MAFDLHRQHTKEPGAWGSSVHYDTTTNPALLLMPHLPFRRRCDTWPDTARHHWEKHQKPKQSDGND